MKPKKSPVIHFGPARVTIKRSGLALLGLKRENDGWADHVTIRRPPESADIPPDHDFKPHLTRRYPEKKKPRREDINGGSLTGAELMHLMDEFKRALIPRLLEYTRLANLALFDSAGYIVLPSESPELNTLFDAAFRCFEPAPGAVECGIPDINDWLLLAQEAAATQCGQAFSPTKLRGQTDGRYSMVHMSTEGPEMIGELTYLPRGLPSSSWTPGWYLTHVNWLTMEFMDETMNSIGGGKLVGIADQIAKAFGFSEPDADEP